ncbi:MAG: redoxin domain-containing protein, partial [Candidatus Poribacteria bacterium]|nr:redoxin domain-containing protein [Candidatus Poribacteria bacterium]
MRRLNFAFLALLILAVGCGKSDDATSRPSSETAPSAVETTASVPIVTMATLHDALSAAKGDVVVLNFWATWCVPCVEEMPQFKRLVEQYGEQGLRVIAVSFDEVDEIDSRVVPYIEQADYPFEYLVKDKMAGPEYEAFINSVDPEWIGNVPATFIYDREGVKRAAVHEETT